MQPELQRRFDAIERQRSELENRVTSLSDAALNWTPEPGVWSVRQIVHHLVLSDETLGRAQDAGAVANEALMFRVLPRSVRRAMILSALRHDKVLPLPSTAIEPRGDITITELGKRWEAIRAEMRRELGALSLDERRYSHPVLGPVTAVQMLELEETHTAYHTRQIEALQQNKAFPLRDISG